MSKPVRTSTGDVFEVPSGTRVAHVHDAGLMTLVLWPDGQVRVLSADGAQTLDSDAATLAALLYFPPT